MDGINKYNVIKELVDQDGNKNRAAQKLGCSRRSIDRYIKGYKAHGKKFFVHIFQSSTSNLHLTIDACNLYLKASRRRRKQT